MFQKFFIKKDYNQMRKKSVPSSCIYFDICDVIVEREIDKVYIEIQNIDNAEDIRAIKLDYTITYKGEFHKFVMPFDKNGVYKLRLFILDKDNNIIEESAYNTITFDWVGFDIDKIQQTPEYDFVQGLLKDLNEIKDNVDFNIKQYIATCNINTEIYSYIDKRMDKNDEQFNSIIGQMNKLLDTFISNDSLELIERGDI